MRGTHVCLILLPLIASLLVSGCSDDSPTRITKDKPEITWVDAGIDYTEESITELLDAEIPATLSSVNGSEADAVRHDVLVDLRAQGADKAAAADLLTSVFTQRSAAVPFRIERATYEKEQVLVVTEAVGSDSSPLRSVRIWVLAKDGAIRYFESR